MVECALSEAFIIPNLPGHVATHQSTTSCKADNPSALSNGFAAVMKNGGVGCDDFLRHAIREREREKAVDMRAFIAVSALAALVARARFAPPKTFKATPEKPSPGLSLIESAH